jgi:hypothetical protein
LDSAPTRSEAEQGLVDRAVGITQAQGVDGGDQVFVAAADDGAAEG